MRIEQLVACIVFFTFTGCLQLFVEKHREHLAHPYKCCKERSGLEIPTLIVSHNYTQRQKHKCYNYFFSYKIAFNRDKTDYFHLATFVADLSNKKCTRNNHNPNTVINLVDEQCLCIFRGVIISVYSHI